MIPHRSFVDRGRLVRLAFNGDGGSVHDVALLPEHARRRLAVEVGAGRCEVLTPGDLAEQEAGRRERLVGRERETQAGVVVRGRAA